MTHFHDNDDPMAARLRAALNAEAAMTNPGDDGLSNIRTRTAVARPWWQHPGALAVAAAVVLGVLVGGGFALLGSDGSNPDDNVIANQTTTAPEPSTSDTPSATPSPSPSGGHDGVYVYYVMDDPVSGPRLYREEHPSPDGSASGVAAVQAMFSTAPDDPDYRSLWPKGTRVLSANGPGYGDDALGLNLSDWPGGSPEEVSLAIQQLVYTFTANQPSVKSVVLQLDGSAPPGDVPVPVTRAPMVDVQGFIWLLSPSEGSTVSSPVQIDGYGTAFEGTISWEIRRDGEVVAEGFTQGGSMGEFGEFHSTYDLEPGTYEIRAFESSAEDGSPLHVDTKTFTVR